MAKTRSLSCHHVGRSNESLIVLADNRVDPSQQKVEPTKTDIGNYWHDKLQNELDGAKDAALTDAVIFFFRVADAAGLGKFITPGRGRPIALLRSDLEAISRAVTSTPAATDIYVDSPPTPPTAIEASHEHLPTQASTPGKTSVQLRTSPAIHINLEIHIAADATPKTVEEIFKNMRKYVLDDGE